MRIFFIFLARKKKRRTLTEASLTFRKKKKREQQRNQTKRRYVQYLPTPVVGGYLAYIGFFCGSSGLALMSSVPLQSGYAQWLNLLESKAMILTLPGLFGGALVYALTRKYRNMFVLPACMFGIVAIFYSGIHAAGMNVEEARVYGWIGECDAAGDFIDTWKYFRFDLVDWIEVGGICYINFCIVFVVFLLFVVFVVFVVFLSYLSYLSYLLTSHLPRRSRSRPSRSYR